MFFVRKKVSVEVVISFFSFLQGLGVAVMMPIILTIIGCALGAGFGKSLKAGLMVGVGFIGLNLVSCLVAQLDLQFRR